MQDLEKALNKREVLGVKGRATQARSKTVKDAGVTRQEQDKAMAELAKSIKDTEREVRGNPVSDDMKTGSSIRSLHFSSS